MSGNDVDHKHLLKNARTVLLVDWASPDVPRALRKAGLKVFSYAPDHYSVIDLATNINGDQPPGGEKLIFRKLDGQPGPVDIVNVYRPEEEHAAIVANHVLPLKAKVLWLQPPLFSAKTADLARANGLVFVEGSDIVEVAQRISDK